MDNPIRKALDELREVSVVTKDRKYYSRMGKAWEVVVQEYLTEFYSSDQHVTFIPNKRIPSTLDNCQYRLLDGAIIQNESIEKIIEIKLNPSSFTYKDLVYLYELPNSRMEVILFFPKRVTKLEKLRVHLLSEYDKFREQYGESILDLQDRILFLGREEVSTVLPNSLDSFIKQMNYERLLIVKLVSCVSEGYVVKKDLTHLGIHHSYVDKHLNYLVENQILLLSTLNLLNKVGRVSGEVDVISLNPVLNNQKVMVKMISNIQIDPSIIEQIKRDASIRKELKGWRSSSKLVLSVLKEFQGHYLTQKEVRERTGLIQSEANRALNRLQKDGLIEGSSSYFLNPHNSRTRVYHSRVYKFHGAKNKQIPSRILTPINTGLIGHLILGILLRSSYPMSGIDLATNTGASYSAVHHTISKLLKGIDTEWGKLKLITKFESWYSSNQNKYNKLKKIAFYRLRDDIFQNTKIRQGILAICEQLNCPQNPLISLIPIPIPLTPLELEIVHFIMTNELSSLPMIKEKFILSGVAMPRLKRILSRLCSPEDMKKRIPSLVSPLIETEGGYSYNPVFRKLYGDEMRSINSRTF